MPDKRPLTPAPAATVVDDSTPIGLATGAIKGTREDAAAQKPGNYGRHPRTSDWQATTPDGAAVGLARHEVFEHTDGTISVEQMIGDYFLRKGVWQKP